MIALVPNVFYAEDELLKELRVSKKWLRRTVAFEWRDGARAWRGDVLLAAMRPKPPAAAPRGARLSGVYFIACDECGVVKIGESGHIRSRLRALITGHPGRHVLRLLGYLPVADAPGRQELERAFHEEFAGSRVNGEWFLFSHVAQARIAGLELTRP